MEITDPRAIRALAHPLRLDLLHLLRAVGPSTAAECGRVLGASQASCSFHLRQLARYGYVEETEPGHDRRERRWRASNRRLSVRVADDDVAVRQEVERVGEFKRSVQRQQHCSGPRLTPTGRFFEAWC